MSLSISTNIASMVAQYNFGKNNAGLNRVNEQLATGYKINRAADNAAGLTISEKLQSQIKGIEKAYENSQEGINLLQIAEGSLSVINEDLQRIRELVIQAASDGNSSMERESIRLEVAQRVENMRAVKASTKFNKVNLLDGSQSTYYIRTGPNSNSAENSLDISSALAETLQTFLGTDVAAGQLSSIFSNGDSLRSFIDKVDQAIDSINNQRSTIGAYQNRLDSIINNLEISSENLISTNSRIRSIDYAKASADMVKFQILQQSTAQVLTQSNGLPRAALDLLQG